MLWLAGVLVVVAGGVAWLAPRRGRSPAWAVPVAGLAVLATLTPTAEAPPVVVALPDVSGLTATEAAAELRAENLAARALFRCLPGTEGEVVSAYVQEGGAITVDIVEVLDQDGPLPAGDAIPEGTVVYLLLPRAAACPGGTLPPESLP